jgi:hypothetical protein
MITTFSQVNENPIDKHYVKRVFEILSELDGHSPTLIAFRLRELEIVGKIAHMWHCPLANYLNSNMPANRFVTVGAYEVTVRRIISPPNSLYLGEISLSNDLRDFIKLTDNGAFPFLLTTD